MLTGKRFFHIFSWISVNFKWKQVFWKKKGYGDTKGLTPSKHSVEKDSDKIKKGVDKCWKRWYISWASVRDGLKYQTVLDKLFQKMKKCLTSADECGILIKLDARGRPRGVEGVPCKLNNVSERNTRMRALAAAGMQRRRFFWVAGRKRLDEWF